MSSQGFTATLLSCHPLPRICGLHDVFGAISPGTDSSWAGILHAALQPCMLLTCCFDSRVSLFVRLYAVRPPALLCCPGLAPAACRAVGPSAGDSVQGSVLGCTGTGLPAQVASLLFSQCYRRELLGLQESAAAHVLRSPGKSTFHLSNALACHVGCLLRCIGSPPVGLESTQLVKDTAWSGYGTEPFLSPRRPHV